MTIPDTIELVSGIPLVAVVPALVEVAKRLGLPARFAGLAAIALATALLATAGVALGEAPTAATAARWVIGGVVYGLAASGLYAQRELLGRGREAPPATVSDGTSLGKSGR